MGYPWPASGTGEYLFGGFRPSYNFYGCCNDPTTGSTVNLDGDIDTSTMTSVEPDWKFNDLICQPFKKARDATRQFLQRVDFIVKTPDPGRSQITGICHDYCVHRNCN